jgi:outer membrane protein TolC
LAVADSIRGGVLPAFGSEPFDAQKLVSFQQASSNLELQRLQVQRIRAGYLPTLGLTATYGTLNFAQTFDRAFSNFIGFGSFGLRLNLPIFDGFQRDAQIQQQKLTVLTQEAQQRLNVEAYRLQFSNSLSQIQKAQINAQNDSRNVQLAQEVYNITTLQYKQGIKSITDLINADNSYRQAQFNYINSLISFYQARLDLEQSQGTLLNFYNEL